MIDHRQRTAWRLPVLALLIVYWLLLTTGTHLPPSPDLIPEVRADKLLHFSAYAGLGFLVALHWSLYRPLGWRQCLTVVAVLSAWGAIDELTQSLVGRDSESGDWLADTAGVALGVIALRAITALVRSRRPDQATALGSAE